jgi:hypothetical protein
MMDRVALRLELVDPGFVRVRRAARTVCATLLSGLMLAVAMSVFGVAEPIRITLFGAGACFFGALLITDPRRSDRAQTLGWASVVAAVAIVVTVGLSTTAVWAAVAFLVLQMFLSYALRPWSLRAANLAVIGALITFLAGAMHIATDRIGWFVIASTVGFASVTASEYLILPDDPLRSLKRSLRVFSQSAGDAVVGVAAGLTMTRDGNAPSMAGRTLRRALDRVMRCRIAIESQLSGSLSTEFGEPDAERMRVALYCAERGVEELIHQANDPQWIHMLPDGMACAITSNVHDLSHALKDNDAHSLDAAACNAGRLRDRLHGAPIPAPKASANAHPEAALSALTTIGSTQLVAQSISQATALVTGLPLATGIAESAHAGSTAQASVDAPPAVRALPPTLALAIQAAVSAVLAGLIAKWLGNEQSLLVAWTAYVVIAGSAEASMRRAWIWLTSTVMGATAGVVIAASIPDNVVCILVVVTIGVFFTIVSAPVSYPAMVFWMNIALVPLFATEGRYLDLIADKAIAALIGGCVAAAVALTVAPVRLSRDLRPAVLQYLDSLDAALEAAQPGESDRRAIAGAALDRAHSALDSIVASADMKTHFFPQSGSLLIEQGIRIDAVHEAFLRLTPTLNDSSRRLHGWTDQWVDLTIRRLRDDVVDAKAAARGDPASAEPTTPTESHQPRPSPPAPDDGRPAPTGLWFIESLHTRLTELTQLFRGQARPGSSAKAWTDHCHR